MDRRRLLPAPWTRVLTRTPLAAMAPVACAVAFVCGSALAAPQEGGATRNDQVSIKARRGNNVSQVVGEVTRNDLAGVTVAVGDKEEKYGSEQVLRVVFGDVPPEYRDGAKNLEHKDYAAAAANFKVVAGDMRARALVRINARLRSAEAFLSAGALEPAHFASAAEEARKFVAEFATNRELPQAQMVLARALVLSGKPAEAAATYREVFGKLAGGKAADGYDRIACCRAGLHAARALLLAEDSLGGRELFGALSATLSDMVKNESEPSAQRALQAIADEAALGEGFADLAAKNSKAALAFFEPKARALDAQASDVSRFATLLGYGEALLGEGRARDAQLALAQVSALDSTDRDRAARALLRQAEAQKKAGDARDMVQTTVEALIKNYGDTPWAGAARKLRDAL